VKSNFRARAQTGLDEGGPPIATEDVGASKSADVRIKQTLADLDAILGIEEDGTPKKKKEEEAGPGPSSLQVRPLVRCGYSTFFQLFTVDCTTLYFKCHRTSVEFRMKLQVCKEK
jgi:hypothetical protein